MLNRRLLLCTLMILMLPAALAAQDAPVVQRGFNIEVLSHVPLGPPLSVTDIVVEQELSRPYAYVGRMQGSEKGFDIIDLSDPSHARVLYRWRIENADLHTGLGGMDPKYFKYKGRYYLVQSLQFGQSGPDFDAGAVVFDVTDLPDVNKLKKVGFVRAPGAPGGFHNIFMYKHSSGAPLLVGTTSDAAAYVYDMGTFIDGYQTEMDAVLQDENRALVGKIPVPDVPSAPANFPKFYHDFYLAYHPETGQDRFYGGGTGGYFVYNVTDLSNPELLVTITGVQGVAWGHTFTPSPDGRYAIGETEYQYAPLRIYDMKPALDGEVQNINEPIAAWTANWENLTHNHEVRWPFVFVSGYEDGLQVFSLMDPEHPVTVAYYDTYIGAHKAGMCQGNICNGAFGVDVRNADGLIVTSDMSTGFWAFRMEGFQGWDGRGWGVPNISSAQDWDHGPAGTH